MLLIYIQSIYSHGKDTNAYVHTLGRCDAHTNKKR